MSTATVTCPDHGNVTVPTALIGVLTIDDIWMYAAPCPECWELVIRANLNPETGTRLVQAGATYSRLDLAE